MKNLKIVTFVTTMMFLGMSWTHAQEKSTVLIKAQVYGGSGFVINTIKPDYTTYELKSKTKNDNALVALKQELDKWILEGYVLVNSTVSSSATAANEMLYLLIKE